MTQLMDYAMVERNDDRVSLLTNNSAYIVGQYIKSYRHRSKSINKKMNKKEGLYAIITCND